MTDIAGSAENDTLNGTTAVDIIDAGDGDDVIFHYTSATGYLDDSIDGGDGYDTLSFYYASSSYRTIGKDAVLENIEAIDANGTADDVTGTARALYVQDGGYYDFSTYDMLGYNGYIYADRSTDEDTTIIGSTESESIYGNDGNDIIDGYGGDDSLQGRDGDDTLYGNTGNDTLYGDDGNDSLFGGDGDDYLNGGCRQ